MRAIYGSCIFRISDFTDILLYITENKSINTNNYTKSNMRLILDNSAIGKAI